MKSTNKPFFKHLPKWVYESPGYESLDAAERWLLHLMSGQASEAAGEGSRVGCRMSEGNIVAKCGMSVRTFKRYLPKLERLGFVVKVGQGGGSKLANEYGIPGTQGALDHKKLSTDERFQTRKTMSGCHGSEAGNHVKLSTEPCQSVHKTMSDCPPNHVRLSPLYTSSIKDNNSINTSEAVFNSVSFLDDDEERVPPSELPDDAGEQQVAKVLKEHGVDLRRARSICKTVSAAAAREAINLSYGQYGVRNRGAYICSLIEGGLEEQQAKIAEERAAMHTRAMEDMAVVCKRIEAMGDSELESLIADYIESTGQPAEGFTVEFVRPRKLWREALGKHLLKRERRQAESENPNQSETPK